MPIQRLQILAPLLIALFAVSCGGSDNSAPVVDASSDDAAAIGDDETADESDDATGSVETFCRMSAEAAALFDEADFFDPESVEAAARGNVELIDAAGEFAPDEISDDLRTIRQALDGYVAVLEENAWDFFAATQALDEVSSRPEFEAAEDRIETWEDANCDFPDDEDEDESDEDPFSNPEALEAMLSSDGGRAMIIEGMIADGELTADQAECLLDNLDIEALSALITGAEPSPEELALFFEIAVLCGLEDMFGFEDMDNADNADNVDAELLEAMLATESGRAIIIEGMIADGELTADQAECMLDNLDIVALAAISNNGEPDPEVFISLFQAADTCDLGMEFFSD